MRRRRERVCIEHAEHERGGGAAAKKEEEEEMGAISQVKWKSRTVYVWLEGEDMVGWGEP